MKATVYCTLVVLGLCSLQGLVVHSMPLHLTKSDHQSWFNLWLDRLKVTDSQDGSFTCEVCEKIAELLQYLFKKGISEDTIAWMIQEACIYGKIQDKAVCEGIVKVFRVCTTCRHCTYMYIIQTSIDTGIIIQTVRFVILLSIHKLNQYVLCLCSVRVGEGSEVCDLFVSE